MLNAKYQLTFTSGHQHPYTDKISEVQNKFLSALLAGLLHKLIEDLQKDIGQQLEIIYSNWNHLKSHQEFKQNTNKSIVDPFISKNRNLLLFQKLFTIFSNEGRDLLNSPLVIEITNKVSQDLIVELLEELLDRFMQEKKIRLSPEDENPFVEQYNKSQHTNAESEENRQLEENQKLEFSPEDLENEIQTIQANKRAKFSHLNYKKTKNNLSKVQYELSEFIHQNLVKLYPRKNEETLLYDYISSLESIPDLMNYVNRPIYKLALRVRNILVLSYFKENVSFSKSDINQLIKHIARLFIEELEIGLVIHIARKILLAEKLESYLKESIYPILCMIQNKITNKTISAEIPASFQDDEILSKLYLDMVKEFRIYNAIPDDEFIITTHEEIYPKITEAFKKQNNYEEIRKLLCELFIKAAEEVASAQGVDINKSKFEQEFFYSNSGNALLELSRLFLFHANLSAFIDEQFIALVKEVLTNSLNFRGLNSYIDSKFSPVSLWTVYLPVDGIKVNDNFPKAFFPELNTSVSELYEVKFISPKILESISIESTSKFYEQPVLISTKADACAVVSNISARTGYQAATTAINILQDTIHSQFFFMRYGGQYHIRIHGLNQATTVCFCKNISEPHLDNPWSIYIISLAKLHNTIEFDLTENTEKLFALPSRFFKILNDRAKRDDGLGRLAQDLIHCIKLYRRGYFTEQLSDRFRLYWIILDTILLPENSSGTAIHLIPYRVSLLCLGIIDSLIKPDDTYTYEQVRLWMREDIEDFYVLVRNPLIHQGIDHTPAYERLLERIESIVRIVLRKIIDYVIYMPTTEDFLENGLDGLLSFLEQFQPEKDNIYNHLKTLEGT